MAVVVSPTRTPSTATMHDTARSPGLPTRIRIGAITTLRGLPRGGGLPVIPLPLSTRRLPIHRACPAERANQHPYPLGPLPEA
jgi:hypothetical protein